MLVAAAIRMRRATCLQKLTDNSLAHETQGKKNDLSKIVYANKDTENVSLVRSMWYCNYLLVITRVYEVHPWLVIVEHLSDHNPTSRHEYM